MRAATLQCKIDAARFHAPPGACGVAAAAALPPRRSTAGAGPERVIDRTGPSPRDQRDDGRARLTSISAFSASVTVKMPRNEPSASVTMTLPILRSDIT